MKCQECGQETFLPFLCPYCGGYFCNDHRLPENHACQKIDVARASRKGDLMGTKGTDSYEYTVSYGQIRLPRKQGQIYFSPKELEHLAIAALLVVGVGFSYGLYIGYSGISSLFLLSASAILLSVSFFAHEIAHKVTAQRRGLWAEFRLTIWGAVATLIFMVLPTPFKLISPGAVMISGSTGFEDTGKISIAGPVTNIAISSILLGAAFVPSAYSLILLLGALLNGFMALFNLIPFGILDGVKVFNWNKRIWALSFGLSFVLTVAPYLMI